MEAVFANDEPTSRALCATDFELIEGSSMPFAGVYKGADGFLAFMKIFEQTLDVTKLELVRSFVSDDPNIAACEFELEATVRSSGERFVSTFVEVWETGDRQVRLIRPHYFHAVRAGSSR